MEELLDEEVKLRDEEKKFEDEGEEIIIEMLEEFSSLTIAVMSLAPFLFFELFLDIV